MLKNEDLKILKELRENSRKQLTQLSKKIGVPATTIFDRKQKLEKKIIKRYVADIKFKEVGYDHVINLIIKTQRLNQMEKFIINNKKVNNAIRIRGRYDYIIEGIFKNIKEKEEFREEIERYEIIDIKEYRILIDLCREKFKI